MGTRREVAAAIANAIRQIDQTFEIVEPRLVINPTPPAIDIYPADPAEADAAFGPVSRQQIWTIRARVSPVDHNAGQDLLLDMMEPDGELSVRAAILADTSLAALVDGRDVEPVTGFQAYQGAGGDVRLLGVEWRLRCFTKTGGES